ncbi:2',5'-phosphodiesterase 12-like [Glandiceps talaboti]
MFARTCNSFLRHFIPLTRSSFGMADVMHRLTVRCVPAEENMEISFVHRDRQTNLLRGQSETLGKSLSRIGHNIKKASEKKKKSKKLKNDNGKAVQPADEEVLVSLFVNNDKISDDLANRDAWKDGAVLHIGVDKYHVERNPPTIKHLTLPDSIMAGFPVYPRIGLEFGHVDDSEFTWYKELKSDETDAKMETDRLDDDAVAMETASPKSDTSTVSKKILKIQIESSSEDWVEVMKGKVFQPQISDVGFKIKVNCEPKNGQRRGNSKERISDCEISAGPGVCPFENRHLYTQKRVGNDGFRVVSYNILADQYATTEFAQNVLYPYCAPYALSIDYRQQLILKELTGYNADIICLQEMGKTLYNTVLYPALQLEGMEGMYTGKVGSIREGEAIFYCKDKFRLLSTHDINLNDAIKDPMNSDLFEKVSQNKVLLDKVLSRSAILQVAILETLSEPKRKLCVANTHLYFHPKAANIRLIQTDIIIKHLQYVKSLYPSQDSQDDLALTLCGDFNSDPKYGVYRYITKKSIPANYADWHSAGKDEHAEGLALEHDFNLTSACGVPDYTNFVAGFQAALDYIFINESLDTKQSIPMPTYEELSLHTALPSVVFPSDHIALICDLAWKHKKTAAQS